MFINYKMNNSIWHVYTKAFHNDIIKVLRAIEWVHFTNIMFRKRRTVIMLRVEKQA